MNSLNGDVNLLECYNAMWPKKGKLITCRAGHKLTGGKNTTTRIERGELICCRSCQGCEDLAWAGYYTPDDEYESVLRKWSRKS